MLRGYTVGITADRRWQEQATLFERRGATVVHGPSIRTRPVGCDARLRAAIDEVIRRRPRAFVANTGVGVRSMVSAAEAWGLGEDLVAALGAARTYARGPKASGALHSIGLDVVSRAPTERLGEAVDLLLAGLAPGEVVAFQVDGSGDAPALERLRAAGVEVIAIPAYEWTLPADVRPAVRLAEAVVAGKVHAVTFTSAPAVRNLVSILRDHDLDEAFRQALGGGEVVVGCVGPVCAEAAAAEGLDPAGFAVPAAFRLGPLVRAVADALAARELRVQIGGTPVGLSGTRLSVGADTTVLSATEARLLAVLAGRVDVVVSKRDLAATVWRDPDLDPHAVEAAIARLRRRLGPLGAAIAVVPRRGYALRS